MKKLLLTIAGAFSMLYAGAQTTQSIDISTGIGVSIGSVDTRWSSTSGTVRRVTAHTSWITDSWTTPKWISPSCDASGNLVTTAGGDYTYKMSFSSYCCKVSNATFYFDQIAGDNLIKSVQVNSGPVHDLSFWGMGFSNYGNVTQDIAGGDIIPCCDTNHIYITVHNNPDSNGNGTVTGLLLGGHFDITYSATSGLTPHIVSDNAFCAGDAITVDGSTSSGVLNYHNWTIVECTSTGTPTGSIWTSSNIFSSPGLYTFPSTGTGGPLVKCGKYYLVTLTMYNSCSSSASAQKIIFVNCLPAIDAGPDVTICSGSCVTIGTGGRTEANVTYNWTGPGGMLPQHTKTITVCPTTTTTYTLSAVNSVTECVSIDPVTVTVATNHSTFNYSDNLTPITYYTVTVQMTPMYYPETSITGWGDTWVVQELNPTTFAVISSTDLGTLPNPPCWWTYGGALSFPGYTSSANVNCGPGPAYNTPSPTTGQFLYGHRYKIIHTTWNNYCSAVQSTYDSYHATRMLAAPNTNGISTEGIEVASASANVITNTKDLSLDVYPNPGSGIFNVELNNSDKTIMEVYDMLGNKVKSVEITGHYQLDLAGYSKGIYMIKTIMNGQQIIKKIILE